MTAHLLYFLSICFILWFVYPAPPSLIIQRNYCFFFYLATPRHCGGLSDYHDDIHIFVFI